MEYLEDEPDNIVEQYINILLDNNLHPDHNLGNNIARFVRILHAQIVSQKTQIFAQWAEISI